MVSYLWRKYIITVLGSLFTCCEIYFYVSVNAYETLLCLMRYDLRVIITHVAHQVDNLSGYLRHVSLYQLALLVVASVLDKAPKPVKPTPCM